MAVDTFNPLSVWIIRVTGAGVFSSMGKKHLGGLISEKNPSLSTGEKPSLNRGGGLRHQLSATCNEEWQESEMQTAL